MDPSGDKSIPASQGAKGCGGRAGSGAEKCPQGSGHIFAVEVRKPNRRPRGMFARPGLPHPILPAHLVVVGGLRGDSELLWSIGETVRRCVTEKGGFVTDFHFPHRKRGGHSATPYPPPLFMLPNLAAPSYVPVPCSGSNHMYSIVPSKYTGASSTSVIPTMK